MKHERGKKGDHMPCNTSCQVSSHDSTTTTYLPNFLCLLYLSTGPVAPASSGPGLAFMYSGRSHTFFSRHLGHADEKRKEKGGERVKSKIRRKQMRLQYRRCISAASEQFSCFHWNSCDDCFAELNPPVVINAFDEHMEAIRLKL